MRKRTLEIVLGTAGSICLNSRDSVAKSPAKGYLLIMAADLEMDGCGGLGESWPARTVTPARLSHGRRREQAGACGTRPTGHGSKNQGHREMAGVKETLSRPIRRLEDVAEVVVAMAGGQELSGARE